MPAPMPSMGQRVIVQDLSAEPPVESSPGIVISGEPDGTAVVFVMTVNGSEVIEDISWDDTVLQRLQEW